MSDCVSSAKHTFFFFSAFSDTSFSTRHRRPSTTFSSMPYTFRAGDLPKLDLDVDRGSDFLAWEKQWNSYMTLSGLAGSDAAIKVHALQFCMSRETLTIVENLGLTDAQKADQAQIIVGLKQYVQGRINETVERRNFRQRKQAPGETYLVSLRELQ